MSKIQANWWKIGHAKREPAYGTQMLNADIDLWYRTNEAVIAEWGGEESTDEEEIKGYVGVSGDGVDVVKKRGQITIQAKPNAELIGHFLKSMMAAESVAGAADPYTHTIKQPTTAVIRPQSFSVITGEDRHAATSFLKHGGVVPATLELNWAQDQTEGSLSATLVTDGVPTDASAVSAPTASLKGSRLHWHHLTASLYPAGDTPINISSIIRSCQMTFDAGLEEEQRASRGVALGTVFHGRNAPTCQVNLVVEGVEGDTIWSYWSAGTKLRLVLDFSDGGTPARQFKLEGDCWIPRDSGQIASIDNGIVQVLTLPLRFRYNDTDTSSWIANVKNGVAAYLATASE